jgi:hypothetical protein
VATKTWEGQDSEELFLMSTEIQFWMIKSSGDE